MEVRVGEEVEVQVEVEVEVAEPALLKPPSGIGLRHEAVRPVMIASWRYVTIGKDVALVLAPSRGGQNARFDNPDTFQLPSER